LLPDFLPADVPLPLLLHSSLSRSCPYSWPFRIEENFPTPLQDRRVDGLLIYWLHVQTTRSELFPLSG
ncbi:hypothetical protein ACHAXS_008535, partial [Conticribra weissflogii]